ncbi:hypothetical protein ACM26W_11090 [Halomonas sp. HK25]|uniref:hypothetical protein n=1 Tax=Halomonas sp. HK25 TaxID=3394321 RepID=UPI0039FD33BD
MMTTERVPTLWDQLLPSTRRQIRQRTRNTERFLTLRNRPVDDSRSAPRRRRIDRQA